MDKKQVAITLLVFAAVVAGMLYFIFNMPQKGEQFKTTEDRIAEAKSKTEAVLKNYFDEQTRGRDGAQAFCDKANATMFYAVRSWTLVDSSFYDEGGTVKIRVDSSNKGGMQITKIWTFHMKKQNGVFCIGSISED